MDNKNIFITPTPSKHISCALCQAQNYPGGTGAYVLDLYDLHIGSQTTCLCAQCLGKLRMEIGKTLEDRNLPTVYAIVMGDDFRLQIVEGKKDILRDGNISVLVKSSSVSETRYTFSADAAATHIFSTLAEAQANFESICK